MRQRAGIMGKLVVSGFCLLLLGYLGWVLYLLIFG